MPHIVPIRDLRDTNKISEMCHKSNEPIYVTKNGYDDMVIMSSQTYDTLLARINMSDAIMVASQQIDNGEGLDGILVRETLGKKYGK